MRAIPEKRKNIEKRQGKDSHLEEQEQANIRPPVFSRHVFLGPVKSMSDSKRKGGGKGWRIRRKKKETSWPKTPRPDGMANRIEACRSWFRTCKRNANKKGADAQWEKQ